MRIVLIGTVSFSKEMLSKLLECSAQVVGVVTSEDTGLNADHADLVPVCQNRDIPVLLTNNANNDTAYAWIKECKPDILFCFGWSRLLKTRVVNVAPMGVVGYHPTKLPSNRGRHPLIWSIVLGLSESASTFFFMDDGVDSGDILNQRDFLISADENASSLYKKIVEVAKHQVDEFLPLLTSGQYPRKIQQHVGANYWRKRGRNDGQIDFRMSAGNIHKLVRALTKPYVGAHFVRGGQDIKVWDCKVDATVPVVTEEPGKVLRITSDGYPVIKCGDKAIRLTAMEPQLTLSEGEYL